MPFVVVLDKNYIISMFIFIINIFMIYFFLEIKSVHLLITRPNLSHTLFIQASKHWEIVLILNLHVNSQSYNGTWMKSRTGIVVSLQTQWLYLRSTNIDGREEGKNSHNQLSF